MHGCSGLETTIVDSALVRRMDQSEEELAGADVALIALIAAGERQGLDELYCRYRMPLFRYLLQLTPDRRLAEELLQDTLVAVWRSARSFAGKSSVRTWLFGIARRQAHNTLRRRGLPLVDLARLDNILATEPDPETEVLHRMAHRDLLAALNRLSPLHREVLFLTFVEEQSYRETADVLGVPIGTVKSRLSHARQALRALLEAKEESER